MLSQHREESRGGVESLEIRVHALLGLAELAVSLKQSISGYQLSLQALRLLQEVKVDLKELDVFLWVECRYWMVRSLVGMEALPGGGALLMEVWDLCEESGKLGEVELVAAIGFAAAEHALSLLPCQLQAAQQHSQVCTHACDMYACM